ncbi:MAG: MBL fold metallo-hydrolase [Patescibacteria group bacterium]|nr:MBL fold metallo-hydrolase [Patescibacteria group bacterium]
MITKISPEVSKIKFKNFGSLVYLIKIKNQNILIDTSSKENEKELVSSLKELNLTPKDISIIILTHAHYDHIDNITLFPNSKIYSDFKKAINRNHSQTKIKNILPIEKQLIKKFKIYKTPGHTQNDILILYKNILFSGDVIFHRGSIGRTDLPESSPEKMKKSLEFIKTINYEILAPGHGSDY